MKRFKYPALVIAEAKKLKKIATSEELNKLDYKTLNPQSTRECIYGKMCGNCFSQRAKELIEKSCTRVYTAIEGKEIEESKINGSPINKFRSTSGARILEKSTTYFSPIEVFITKKKNIESGANERLVAYLKGEIKTL